MTKERPVLFEVSIDKMVYGGSGLGRHEGKVVFVPFAAPGDTLLVRSVRQKKNLIYASVERLLTPGPTRRAPFCVHFGTCGGCQWQHLDYEAQVEIKRSILEELFHHRFPETRPIRIDMRRSPQAREYRSRGRIQFRGHGSDSAVGFYGFQSQNVIDVQACPLFRPALNTALRSLREQWKAGSLDPGMSQAELLSSEEEGNWAWEETGPSLEDDFSSFGRAADVDTGAVPLRRKIGEHDYKIVPSVFFQANDFMTADLVATVREQTGVSRHDSALDLYAGVGLFSLPLARRFSRVTSVEASAEACRLCEGNAAAEGLDNIRVVCADVDSWMKAVSTVTAPGFDLIILDPPRCGAGCEVMRRIEEWAPEAVIYVSCDPQTLVRDLAVLTGRDYRIDFIQGLDLFPQTFHFESVVHLTRRRQVTADCEFSNSQSAIRNPQ